MNTVKAIPSKLLGDGYEMDSLQLINSNTALAYSNFGKAVILNMSELKSAIENTVVVEPLVTPKLNIEKCKSKLAKNANNVICLASTQLLVVDVVNCNRIASKSIEQGGTCIDCSSGIIAVGFEGGNVQVLY